MGVRITGLDTPLGGMSWEYTDSEKKGIQQLFDYLETKRFKYEVYEINVKFNFQNGTKLITKKMIDACNTFLDDLQNVNKNGIIYKSNGDWEDILVFLLVVLHRLIRLQQ